jgi:16S rRNA (cytosine967-C5)-methyltransferase
MISPARVAALKILTSISAGSADLPTAIAQARTRLADDRDRAMAADIATGVQRWRARLDHLIVAVSNRPLDRLDQEVIEILRLSIYQLLHHTRVPASAVVDDAVDLTRKAGKRSATGFVNAVLRGISRTRGALPLPPRPADTQRSTNRAAVLDYLSITLSHPRWLASRWLDRVGFLAAEAWLTFNNTPAPLTLRVNHLRTSREDLLRRFAADGIVVAPGAFGPDALLVEGGQPLAGPGLDEGWFVPQDEASQIVPLLAGPAPGTRVLDTCAAPGGKTTALAAAMQNTGLLVASDVRPRRMALLRQTIAATGATNVALVQADLLQPLPFGSGFDCVVLDAPCSGLGTIRRDPDIRWRRCEADLAPLAAAARRMLAHAADAVAPGGRLVYATCSSEPEENEAVVDGVLGADARFTPRNAREVLPAALGVLVDPRGHLRTEPHLHGLEAFFGAVFERRS